MIDTAKPLIALAGAWCLGVWTGINWLALEIDATWLPNNEPAWVAPAEQLSMASIAVAGVCVVSWMILDYRSETA